MYLTKEEIENFDNYGSPDEKDVALFFKELGLECIALCFKIIADDGSDVTDIDGIFLDTENKVILIYDDSKQKKDSTSKIALFFSKCSQTKYEQQIYDAHENLPQYPIKILYIDRVNSSNVGNKRNGSLEHVLTEHTAILYKDDFEYFKTLVKKMKKWALNDLYNFLNIKLPNARIEISAVKIYIGNTPAYLYASKPHELLKYAFVSRRRGNDDGYQRMVDFRRTKEIAGKLKEGEISGFMTSILLNSTAPLEEKSNISKSHTPSTVKLIISNHFSSCKVVDGQHRLLSFTELEEFEQSRFSIPVVLMDNLPIDEEKRMFLEINNNAKKVDPNLEYDIMSDIKDWDEDSDEYKIKLGVLTVKELEKSTPIKSSVYHGTIGESKKDSLTLKGLVDMLITHNYINQDKNIFNEEVVTETDIRNLAKNIKDILALASRYIKDKGNLKSNRIIDLILRHSKELIEKKITEEDSYDTIKKELLDNDIGKFIQTLADHIEELSDKKFYGSGAYKNMLDFIYSKMTSDVS